MEKAVGAGSRERAEVVLVLDLDADHGGFFICVLGKKHMWHILHISACKISF